MANAKTLLIVGLIKKHCIKISQYFPEPYSHLGNIKVKLDLPSYEATLQLSNRNWYV